MINLKLIYKIIGQLLFIEAALMAVCLAMAIFFRENDMVAFGVAVAATALCGLYMRFKGRGSDNSLSRRDAYLVVALTWVVFSLLGTLPFLVSGYLTSFTDAFFETMSGFTTTGATMISNVEALPHGLLFWRSLMQWIGGLGIVFFTIALLPSLVGGSVKVFAAEATGPLKTKLHPRLSTGAKWLWVVLIVITVLCTASLYLAGMGLFDSLNYGMTAAATGGFATLNCSGALSPLIQYIITFFCFVAGVNFTLLYVSVSRFRLGMLFRSAEFKFYLTLISVTTLFIMLELVARNGYDWEHAFRSSVFQVVSFATSSGFVSDDAALWPHVTWAALAVCMFFGACSGSTSGGFKCVRGVMLLKTIKNEFRQILHPNAVLPLKIDGVNVPSSKRVTLLAFLTVYLILALVCSFVLMAMGINNTNAITLTLSSLGNVGLTLGSEIGPTMSLSVLPTAAKWICCTLMLIGRLEVFSVLVIFTPQFWKDN
jgi:trk system potassium uptake protein